LDGNFSWNCGAEGETDSPSIRALRMRMQKNFMATLFLSLGTPMMLGGDEFGRTQKGNNNAYCQDNEISWYNWKLLDANHELFRFSREIIRFRMENKVFRRTSYFDGKPLVPGGHSDIEWFDFCGRALEWNNGALSLACRIDGAVNDSVAVCLMFNPSFASTTCLVPAGAWRIRVDTAERDPEDIMDAQSAPLIQGGSRITLMSKSMVVLTEAQTIQRAISDLD
jgi:glycogen operon protein